jgi:hypothetical protein
MVCKATALPNSTRTLGDTIIQRAAYAPGSAGFFRNLQFTQRG